MGIKISVLAFWQDIHFTYFEAISSMKTKKNRGEVSIFPRKKTKTETSLSLSFGVDPLNWQSSIEIGEMACSTTARCFVYTLLTSLRKSPSHVYYQFFVTICVAI